MLSNNAREIVVAIIITLSSLMAIITLIALCIDFGRSNNTTHRTTIDRIPTSVIAPVPIGHHTSHASFCALNVKTTLPGVPVHHGNNHSSSLFTSSRKSGGDFGYGGSVKVSSTNHDSSLTRLSAPTHSMSRGLVGHTPSFVSAGGGHHGVGGGGNLVSVKIIDYLFQIC